MYVPVVKVVVFQIYDIPLLLLRVLLLYYGFQFRLRIHRLIDLIRFVLFIILDETKRTVYVLKVRLLVSNVMLN